MFELLLFHKVLALVHDDDDDGDDDALVYDHLIGNGEIPVCNHLIEKDDVLAYNHLNATEECDMKMN